MAQLGRTESFLNIPVLTCCLSKENKIRGWVRVTEARHRNFLSQRNRLHSFDSLTSSLLLPASLVQWTGRCVYVGLRLYSARGNGYSAVVAQRCTADQERTTVVLGLLAFGSCFCDCSSRCDGGCRAVRLIHCTASIRLGFPHDPNGFSESGGFAGRVADHV